MVKAKKEFGQNFLKDSYFVSKIIEAMPNSGEKLIEIGPGLGDLTKEILKVRSVLAIEIDRDLASLLKTSFAKELESGRFELINADVIYHWERHGSLAETSYDLVANLPYYVATEIILRALKDPKCRSLLVMIQKEVADKFLALPKQKKFSSLSLLAQSVGEVELVCEVPPEAFDPVPKVDSAVIKITKNRDSYDENFAKFLKKAFTQPRKTLQKNLTAFYRSDEIAKAFNQIQLAQTIRPHELELTRFLELFLQLEGVQNGKRE